MESLRKLEELQTTMTLMQSHGIISNSSDHESNRFVSNFILFMVKPFYKYHQSLLIYLILISLLATISFFVPRVSIFFSHFGNTLNGPKIQPCGELDLGKKCALVSEFIPKISSGFLEKAATCLTEKGFQQHVFGEELEQNCVDKSDYGEMAVIGLDAMQRANSTLEDFCRSYFMFHGMEVNEPQALFKYLPVLSFTESYIYQLDSLNEKILPSPHNGVKVSEKGYEETDPGLIAKFIKVFKDDPFRPLAVLLGCHGLLTERIQEEFKHGEEYWTLERMLCRALVDGKEISVKDVIRAIHLKSFDYRVLNLLLYQLRGMQVNEVHMDFLSISEFLVEVADDLFDYEDDVLENNFNILRMFVRIYGTSAPAMLAKYIAEAEEKYNILLKTLDSQLSLDYHRRCEEATQEGGSTSKHPLGTWNIPKLIVDEELYRSNVLDIEREM
ncbi:uncharacterized protein LOC115715305 isoform X2 [Cannabis sativa]|uniref:uncharacterized protein LOC115715305 isoform X2 n=1 Tax=Cannabis sativa TaxID=3483 RepID=UPI0011E02B5A|nr:uncharacterized protein LOC115715305 isoform X2 [Cannabis sativa]